MNYQLMEEHQCFSGKQYVYSHWSDKTNSTMRFALYLPPQSATRAVPVVYWLSGLTCSEQNFITKAGAQHMAAELGIAIVCPDTSPRGFEALTKLSDDDFGESASFYVNAQVPPWAAHYQMYDYISQELPSLIHNHFPVDGSRCGIFGHSMGGHGALVIGLRNSQLFRSLSALAPICSPSIVPWGIKAFTGYLGQNQSLWQQYDACELMRHTPWPHGPILVDQGDADPFLSTQLKPELLAKACQEAGVGLQLRLQQGYGHNYYFIASFISDHLRFHAQQLYS